LTGHHLLKSQTSHEELVLLTFRTSLLAFFLLILPLCAQDPPQNPPPTPPQQQTPPPTVPSPATVEPTPPIPKPVVQTPTKPVPPPDLHEHDTGGDGWSVEPIFWLTHAAPTVRQGLANQALDPGNLAFPDRSKFSEGVEITVPTLHEDSLDFTAFVVKGQGNSVLGTSEAYFGNLYAVGDTLATNYYTKSYKLSWNYLTYPYPSNGAKFRLKTLYEIQYVSIGSSFDAPGDVNAAPIYGTSSLFRPTFGAGFEYHPVRRVRFEMKASGFALPHHGDIWGSEASLVVRGWHFEASAGARIFHYKTSPQEAQYFTQTMWGPYGGIRFLWRP
jgi:hypothetical protein